MNCCPYCGATPDEMDTQEVTQIHHPPGMTRTLGDSHPKDTEKHRVECDSCGNAITGLMEADSTNEAIARYVSCDHEHRTNRLVMSTRPSDHLDTMEAVVECEACKRYFDSVFASVDRDGTPRIA